MALEFLSDLCANGGDGETEGVHALDLGGLNHDIGCSLALAVRGLGTES